MEITCYVQVVNRPMRREKQVFLSIPRVGETVIIDRDDGYVHHTVVSIQNYARAEAAPSGSMPGIVLFIREED